MKPIDLPLIAPLTERADAARNRQRILVAAQTLFARDGVAGTSMDAIAAEAGVGKGTLFRRFGDRASLALALLETSESAFQEAFIRGPTPLGPGAPPEERLVAFGRRLLQHLTSHGALLASLGAEVVLHQLSQPGMTLERLGAGWETTVRRLINPGSEYAA